MKPRKEKVKYELKTTLSGYKMRKMEQSPTEQFTQYFRDYNKSKDVSNQEIKDTVMAPVPNI